MFVDTLSIGIEPANVLEAVNGLEPANVLESGHRLESTLYLSIV